MRTFVAVEIPQTIRQALGSIEAELRESGADVKWVRPDSVHLTLKFLGEIEAGQVEEIRMAVEDVLPRHAPFSLRVRGMGGFPRLTQPRVVWVGLTGDQGRLGALQREVEGSIGALGFPREERPFQPHLTLGRVRSPKGRERLVAGVQRLTEVDLGEFPVAAVILFRSELLPSGARYTALWELPLGHSES